MSDVFIERSQEECLVLAETARERISRDICTTLELRNVQRLLLKALPERPDLVVVLGHAVTELVTVYDIPYRDVPLIRSALYVLKEQWRYQLLEDWAMQSLSALRNLAAKKDLPPEIREELELLISIHDPNEYRRRLADTLVLRGIQLIRDAA